jgi:4-hydroxy-4-methyl-2-oxoglutarate aldolase
MNESRASELEMAQRLGGYAAPTLYEAAPRGVAALSPAIAPLYRPIEVYGIAYPVLAAPGDNMPHHLAVAEAPAGTVLVIATGSATGFGCWGDILMEAALARGIRGLITDGAVRDSRSIRERGFPIYSAGVAIPGTCKRWPGVLNQPVTIGGALVRPGDYIVGDDDGVVIIAPDVAEETLRGAQARVDKETAFTQRIRQGELTVDLFHLRGDTHGN